MTDTALRLIELHGEGCTESLYLLLQRQLNLPDAGTVQSDLLREGCVILLATVTKFLPSGDPKVLHLVSHRICR